MTQTPTQRTLAATLDGLRELKPTFRGVTEANIRQALSDGGVRAAATDSARVSGGESGGSPVERQVVIPAATDDEPGPSFRTDRDEQAWCRYRAAVEALDRAVTALLVLQTDYPAAKVAHRQNAEDRVLNDTCEVCRREPTDRLHGVERPGDTTRVRVCNPCRVSLDDHRRRRGDAAWTEASWLDWRDQRRERVEP